MLNRRQLLHCGVQGLGGVALAALAHEAAAQESRRTDPLSPRPQHFPAQAKNVIFMFMRGGPSHVDTFDHKPILSRDNGQPAPSGTLRGGRGDILLGSPWKFNPCGHSGIYISELFPHLARQADKLCILNGMHTDIPNHIEAAIQMHTGELRFVRPSVGSWVVYGLGSENQDLPGFISLRPTDLGGARNYSNAFLPAAYQGVPVGNENAGEAINNLSSQHQPLDQQRRQLDFVQSMNARFLERTQVNPELEGVIGALEMGQRMQSSVPQLMDLSQESADTLALYGISSVKRAGAQKGNPSQFGRQCLLARRFIEAGVRYVEINHSNWDTHSALRTTLPSRCLDIDQPIAGLLADLEQRGLLEQTLLVWGGEFGRTPAAQINQAPEPGRDHHAKGFTMWLAGGGAKGGMNYGATDQYGGEAVEGKMHIHDLHATMLHLLGLDHQKLTYRYGGRDYSLTDVHGRVPKEILA